MKFVSTLLLVLVLAVLGAIGFVYSGVYDAGADSPHWPLVFRAIDTLRARSVTVRAEQITPPPLDDPQLIAKGAQHYGEMCDGCHLAPGKHSDEFRDGLYPQPPDLSKPGTVEPAEQFWIIKHGIKGSAMPAWGRSHDDAAIWAMVAFLQKLPALSAEQYQAMTQHEEGSDHEHEHEHEH